LGGLGLASADFEEPDLLVQLGREPQRIDILTFTTGLFFDDAYVHRMLVDVGGLSVPFISVDDLRTNKLATGRLRTRPMPQIFRPARAVASHAEKQTNVYRYTL
jgi:hypothetical protein